MLTKEYGDIDVSVSVALKPEVVAFPRLILDKLFELYNAPLSLLSLRFIALSTLYPLSEISVSRVVPSIVMVFVSDTVLYVTPSCPHTSPHPIRHSIAVSSTLWRMAVYIWTGFCVLSGVVETLEILEGFERHIPFNRPKAPDI